MIFSIFGKSCGGLPESLEGNQSQIAYIITA
jgi:hypothetical protein